MSQPDSPLKYNRAQILRGPLRIPSRRERIWPFVLLVLGLGLLLAATFFYMRARYRSAGAAASPYFSTFDVAQAVEIHPRDPSIMDNGWIDMERALQLRPKHPSPTPTPSAWILCSSPTVKKP